MKGLNYLAYDLLYIQKLCPINILSLINLLIYHTIWVTPFPKPTFRTSIFKNIILGLEK